jgi:hypothetical protein
MMYERLMITISSLICYVLDHFCQLFIIPMNYSNSSESSLRASVQTCISILENALEEDRQVRGHNNADIPFLEQQLDLESDKFIAS